jgi:hypothetical protein
MKEEKGKNEERLVYPLKPLPLPCSPKETLP